MLSYIIFRSQLKKLRNIIYSMFRNNIKGNTSKMCKKSNKAKLSTAKYKMK